MPDACVELVRGANLVLHTGDVTTREALAELEAIGPPVRAVRGNMDGPELQAKLPERLVLEWGGLRIGLVHDAGGSVGRHERLVEMFAECDLIGYGHTHMPEIARVDGIWIVNPGSPTERRRAPVHSVAAVEGGVPRLVTLS